ACARRLAARRRSSRASDRGPQPRQRARRRDHPRLRPEHALPRGDQRLHWFSTSGTQRVGDRPRRFGACTMTMSKTMHRTRSCYARVLALTACESTRTSDDNEPPTLHEAELENGYPQLGETCRGPIVEPTHLVVTSTDFNTG